MNHIFSALIALLISSLSLQTNAMQRQQYTNWCWVAAIQDVASQAGIRQSQPQIAARLDGWPQNRPAYIGELVGLLQSYGFNSWQAGRPASPQELYGTLSSGWKLIAFVRPSNGPVGHYIVLQGINPNNGGVIVSDPATGQTATYSLQQLYYGWRWGDSVVVGKYN
jgi:Papain-like cysteine protease AvrRpt2